MSNSGPAVLQAAELLSLSPVPVLIDRMRQELSASFVPGRPARISRAPGRLDVMGGIADYTGSLVCELPLDRAAAVALQDRDDANLQVISLNLLDAGVPFTFRMPMGALGQFAADTLRREFDHPGRKWAGYIAGCLFLLDEAELICLADPKIKGLNIALYSTIPIGAGVSSSAAMEVATMINLVHHFGLQETVTPMQIASMCQQVENRIVGAPCGIMDQVSACLGEAGKLLRMVCQPHEVKEPLCMPDGIRAIGINSAVRHSVGGGMYGRTRCAAFMGHRIILHHMTKMGQLSGRPLEADPMNGYLANLSQDDYKTYFRPQLPEYIRGDEFLSQYDDTIDRATRVEPRDHYHVQQATDHHVLEARRVRQFCEFLEQACRQTGPKRQMLLNKAGHLMYASHISYTNDALLGAEECDRLVQLVRDREHEGLYGAKITGGGSGGTVAVLADISDRADAAIEEILQVYAEETARKPEAFTGTSPGAAAVGTAIIQ